MLIFCFPVIFLFYLRFILKCSYEILIIKKDMTSSYISKNYCISKSKFKNLNKKYHLYFLGTGELEAHIKELVQKDNLEGYVHFLGYQKNPYKYIKKMNLMFSMSKQEGFSGAIVEGLALGIPFISTDVGGVKELSNDGKFGKIVNSTDDACECIVNYFENSMSVDKSEMKNFITQFTISEQMKNINEILE